jgi:hypothetical protein
MTSKVLLGVIGCEFGFSINAKKLKIDSETPIITPLTNARVQGKSVIVLPLLQAPVQYVGMQPVAAPAPATTLPLQGLQL